MLYFNYTSKVGKEVLLQAYHINEGLPFPRISVELFKIQWDKFHAVLACHLGQYVSWSKGTERMHTAARWMMPFQSPVTLLINNETIHKGRGYKKQLWLLLRGRNSSCLDRYVFIKKVRLS